MDIQQIVYNSLTASRLNNHDLILLGVSGGPDSVVMAHTLHALNWKMAIVYFDHQLRSQASLEKTFVKQMAEQYAVPFYSGKGDITAIARQKKKSLEEAAREERYHFLFSKAQNINACAVAVAHTADDQVETILMHILRGSGTRGLVGMKAHTITTFHPTIPLMRPLLNVWREEIEDYCRQYNLTTKQDASNLDKTYFRNRIRHELIPEMQSYNAGFKTNLVRMGNIVKDDWEVLDQYYQDIFNGIVDHSKKDHIRFSSSEIQKLPYGSQKAVLYLCLTKIDKTDAEIENRTVQRLLDFVLQGGQKKHLQLPAQIHAFRKGDIIILAPSQTFPLDRHYPRCDGEQSCDLEESFHISLGNKSDLKGEIATRKDYQAPASMNGLYWEAFLDVACFQEAVLHIRSIHTGDRYLPLGMNGQSIKVSDLFINKKIPAQVRKTWPVILDGSTIVWIPGFAPSHEYRVNETTQKILHLTVLLST